MKRVLGCPSFANCQREGLEMAVNVHPSGSGMRRLLEKLKAGILVASGVGLVSY